MAHSIIILREKIDAIKGNATSGGAYLLLLAVNAVQNEIDNGEPTNVEAMHAAMQDTQNWLVDGGLTVNPVDTIETFTTELNALL